MMLRPRAATVARVIPALVVAVLSVWRPAWLLPLENATYDAMLRTAPSARPSGRVIIVDVDERSLSKVGQWPWRRDLVGMLVSELRERGAAVVALDIIFAEPDRFDGGAISPDAALAASLRQGGAVLGYGMMFERGETPRTCVQHPVGLALLEGDDPSFEKPYFQAAGSICSLAMLSEAAGSSGFLNAAPDADGLLRRVPLLMEMDGHVYPSLALASVSALTGLRDTALRVNNANASSLLLSSADADDRSGVRRAGPTRLSVPLDGRGNLLLRFRGKKGTFPYLSAVDVLNGRVRTGVFEDKLVLVGTTALGTREVVSTPLDTLFAGIEVQATVADNLLQQDFIQRPEHAVLIETLVALALGVAAVFLVGWVGHAWGAVGVLMAVAGAGVGATWLLSTSGTFLSPLYPTMGLIASLAATIVSGLTVERRRAERAGREREASRRLMVQTLLSLTEIKDAETGRHSRRTRTYTRVLVQELAAHPGFRDYLTSERVDLLVSLAPLHDIGKVGVPDRVLNKPGELTPDEMVEMRKHPVHGRDVIVRAQQEAGIEDDLTLEIAKDIVYTHHERWDGAGYPQGLKGGAIPIPGRVMAVVDVYDAVKTRQLYAARMSQDQAVALITGGRGTHFDPDVVDAFLRVAPIFAQVSEGAELTD